MKTELFDHGHQMVLMSNREHRLADPNYPHAKLVDGPLARRISEFGVHYQTLERCHVLIARLRDEISRRTDAPSMADRAHEEVLMTGLIIEYTRCFGSGAHQLKASDVFSDAEVLERHNQFFAIRSKHIAHDVNGWRDCKVAGMLDEDGEPRAVVRVVTQAIFDTVAIEILFALIKGALGHLHQRILAESGVLLEALRALPKDQLLAYPDFVVTAPELTPKKGRRHRNELGPSEP